VCPAWGIYDVTPCRAPSAAAASEYISELVAAYPSILEVWLFGSRANGSAKPESDWDYMAFAEDKTLAALRGDSRFHCAGIDLMIVIDGDNFAAPWTEDSRSKGGRLAKVDGGWHWTKRTATRATYQASKGDFRPIERCAMHAQRSIARAILSMSSPKTCSPAAIICAAAGWAASHPAHDRPTKKPRANRSIVAIAGVENHAARAVACGAGGADKLATPSARGACVRSGSTRSRRGAGGSPEFSAQSRCA